MIPFPRDRRLNRAPRTAVNGKMWRHFADKPCIALRTDLFRPKAIGASWLQHRDGNLLRLLSAIWTKCRTRNTLAVPR
ncbi:hypothetical protein ACSVBT_19325 [Afipia sp. TerB]